MIKNIEFKVKKEPWNKYKLKDGTILKTRLIMVKVSAAKNGYLFSHQPIFGSIAPTRKKPEKTLSGEEHTIEEHDVDFEHIGKEKWNEYILSDNNKLLAKIQITQVNRSNVYDEHGDPIYSIQWSPLFKVVPVQKEKNK